MKTLNGIPESMLIPLAARAVETDHSEPIINDPYSKTIFEQLDYPFATITQAPSSQIGISIRTFILDRVVKYFIEHTKHPLIINIGALGLKLAIDIFPQAGQMNVQLILAAAISGIQRHAEPILGHFSTIGRHQTIAH